MEREKIAYQKGYRITNNGIVVSGSGNILKPMTASNGYTCFSCRINGDAIKVFYHRLQAYQKYGDKIYDDGVECRHLNSDKGDNSRDNIAVGSHSENIMDMPKEKRIEKAVHASSFIKKHNHDEIKEYYESNDVSYNDIMDKFDISSKGTVSWIINK